MKSVGLFVLVCLDEAWTLNPEITGFDLVKMADVL